MAHKSTPEFTVSYNEAINRLIQRPTLEDVAKRAGVSASTVRKARLDPEGEGYRSPPSIWPMVVRDIAREEARRLLDLAERLDEEVGE